MFILMSSFRDVLGFQCIRGMAADGEALLFFLRVRVEVGEGENTGLQCSQYAKAAHLGTRRGRHSSVCRQRNADYCYPERGSNLGQSPTTTRTPTTTPPPHHQPEKWTQPYFKRKDSTYTAIIMSDINYNVWTSNSQLIYNDELW